MKHKKIPEKDLVDSIIIFLSGFFVIVFYTTLHNALMISQDFNFYKNNIARNILSAQSLNKITAASLPKFRLSIICGLCFGWFLGVILGSLLVLFAKSSFFSMKKKVNSWELKEAILIWISSVSLCCISLYGIVDFVSLDKQLAISLTQIAGYVSGLIATSFLLYYIYLKRRNPIQKFN